MAHSPELSGNALAEPHEQRVLLRKLLGILRQRRQHQRAQRRPRYAPWDDAQTFQSPLRVGVGHEARLTRRVEQDGVGGLRSDAPDTKQLAPQRRRRGAQHVGEVAVVFVPHMGGERLKLGRLLPEGPAGSHQLLAPELVQPQNAVDRQRARGSKILDRLGRAGPCRVLHQQRAGDHLEGLGRGPPALRAKVLRQRVQQRLQPGGQLRRRRQHYSMRITLCTG